MRTIFEIKGDTLSSADALGPCVAGALARALGDVVIAASAVVLPDRRNCFSGAERWCRAGGWRTAHSVRSGRCDCVRHSRWFADGRGWLGTGSVVNARIRRVDGRSRRQRCG